MNVNKKEYNLAYNTSDSYSYISNAIDYYESLDLPVRYIIIDKRIEESNERKIKRIDFIGKHEIILMIIVFLLSLIPSILISSFLYQKINPGNNIAHIIITIFIGILIYIATIFIVALILESSDLREYDYKINKIKESKKGINPNYIKFMEILNKRLSEKSLYWEEFYINNTNLSYELFYLVNTYTMDSFLMIDSTEKDYLLKDIIVPMMHDIIINVKDVYDKHNKMENEFEDAQYKSIKKTIDLDMEIYNKNRKKNNV